MAWFSLGNKHSIERRLQVYFAIWSLLSTILAVLLAITLELEALTFFTLLLAVINCNLMLWYKAQNTIVDVLQRLGLQVDALAAEEFNTWHLAKYQNGQAASLKSDFQRFAARLESKKQEYLQTEEFVFGFIEHLNLPIVILDHHLQLYLANQQFCHLHNASVEKLMGYSHKQLGLDYEPNNEVSEQWLCNPEHNWSGTYQVVEHSLLRNARPYRLLVLFSVEQKLRENEKQVWQKLFRVLNHEVRNSLTPIYSMSQSLQELRLLNAEKQLSQSQAAMEQDMLKVIEARALQLMQFVESYSVFNKLEKPSPVQTSSKQISHRIQAMYTEIEVLPATDIPLYIDVGQLEQAFINLIKNAIEAQTDTDQKVQMTWTIESNEVSICILDNGKGVTNPDNLFVPFYTTKENGTGVGLLLSRELIRNQGGELTLSNRQNTKGCIAKVQLPLSSNLNV